VECTKEESFENAVKISANPHRLYQREIMHREFWAESFIPECSIYHYLPLRKEHFCSVNIHESSHVSENCRSVFYIITFLLDWPKEVMRLIEKDHNIFDIYLEERALTHISDLMYSVDHDWRPFIEASAYIQQILSPLTPRSLSEQIIYDIASHQPGVAEEVNKLLELYNKIIQRMGEQSNWTESELLLGYLETRGTEYERDLAKFLFRNEEQDTNFEGLTTQQLAMAKIIMSSITSVIHGVAGELWVTGKLPSPKEALNYLHQLSLNEIPLWNSPFKLQSFLVKELKGNMRIESGNKYAFIMLPYSLLLALLRLFQFKNYDEVLQKYIYGLSIYLTSPFMPKHCGRLFPVIDYISPSKEFREQKQILYCNQFINTNNPIRHFSSNPMGGKVVPCYTEAIRKLLVVRNKFFSRCNKKCIGERDCPKRVKYYTLVKNSWKPLLLNVYSVLKHTIGRTK